MSVSTTIRMQIQSVNGGPYEDIDLAEHGIKNLRYRYSVNHPAMLTFTITEPHHTRPLLENVFLRLWDEGATDQDGNPQSASNPLFEGWLRTATPGDNPNEINCICHDPTGISAQEVPIMSLPWTSSGGYVQRHTGAIPRLVTNVRIDTDPDYAFQKAIAASVGGILSGILDYAAYPLAYYHAAPDTSTPTSYDMYDATEISLLSFVPQDKMVWESESVRSGLQRVLDTFEPAVKIFWHPGERKWHFRNLYNGTQATITLNDFNATHPVIGYAIERSLDNRYTAVEAFGPETTAINQFLCSFTSNWTLVENGLTPVLSSAVVLENYTDATGAHDAFTYTQFQIIDPEYRAGANLFPSWYAAPFGWLMLNQLRGKLKLNYATYYINTRRPHLQYSFDNGLTWNSTPVICDYLNGIVDIKYPIYLRVQPAPLNGSNRTYFVPTNWKLVWASYTDALSVRYPATGYSGTCFDEDNIRAPLYTYEEMLATGFNRFGTPETTPTRIAQYGEFVTLLHTQRKDVIYTGGAVLDGIDYQWCRLWRRVNVNGVDRDGSTVTTGWEAANMIVTDVDYDFEERLTHLTFSSDQLSLMGFDPDMLRRRLNIRAVERRTYYTWQYHYRDYETYFGNKIRDLAGITETEHVYYVDPVTGRQM